MQEKAKLVSILSQGHSGSTLLDFLIGSIPGTFSTGELIHLPWQLFRSNKDGASLENENVCTCRESIYNCKMWGPTLRDIEKKRNISFKENPYDFKLAVNGSNTFRKRPLIYRVLTKIFYNTTGSWFSNFTTHLYSLLFRKAISNNWLLFDTLCEKTDAEYIIDSSKDPLRYNLLRASRPKDVKVIVLIREIYGVANSGKNYGRKLDFNKSGNSWLKYYNKWTMNSLKGVEKEDCFIVNYRDLTENPELLRDELTSFLGLKKTPFNNEFHTNQFHLVKGNPMRYKKSFSIKYDEKWKKEISEKDYGLLKNYQDQLNAFFK